MSFQLHAIYRSPFKETCDLNIKQIIGCNPLKGKLTIKQGKNIIGFELFLMAKWYIIVPEPTIGAVDILELSTNYDLSISHSESSQGVIC